VPFLAIRDRSLGDLHASTPQPEVQVEKLPDALLGDAGSLADLGEAMALDEA
jgi:hypothetical protein